MNKSNQVSIDYLNEQAKKLRIHTCKLVSERGRGYVQQGLGASDLFSALFPNGKAKEKIVRERKMKEKKK